MARYVDGFVIAVPNKKLGVYRKMAKLARLKKGETVVFSWIVYRSKKHRNSVNARVMKDPRMNNPDFQKDMPFEMKRMAFGGFETLVYW